MSAAGENAEQERLGFAIRILRHRRAVSQEQLGFDCDLHRNDIGAIERGEINPTFRTLLQLAAGLGMRLSEIVLIYENPPSVPRPRYHAGRR
jgi:transcriptional regulator with XRE-family HTH domain